MRNLTVTQRASRSLNSLKDQFQKDLRNSKVLHTIDSSNDDVYLLFQHKLYKIPSDSTEYIIYFDTDKYEFVSLQYCNISQSLYGACKGGDIFRISLESGFQCHLITQLNTHLQCMELSPDHEMIILVTVDDVVITMVSSFQVISEVDLHASNFGEKQFVTVGWGKKETQFHGSEGKRAAIAKPIEIHGNDSDNGLCRISWREDGSLFAVGFLHYPDKIRRFKVFNREGILQYTSELVNGLEEPLSWKPSGNLIATTQNLPHKYVVAFFEKNGLKHREFSLPFKPNEITVKDLFWSPDSEILTVCCEVEKDSSSILQLWSETNYHWYLKQTIKFSANNTLIYAKWSSAAAANSSKRLILITNKECLVCEYNWCISHSRGKSIHDKSVIGVIDANKSLTTALRVGVVPPPMAHQTVGISEFINGMVFAPDLKNSDAWVDTNAFFCVSDSNKLIFYKHIVGSCTLQYECMGSYDIEWIIPEEFENSVYNAHHFLWLDEHCALCSLSTGSQSLLCVLSLDKVREQCPNSRVETRQTHIMDGLIQHIVPSPRPGEAYVVAENTVFQYTKDAQVIPIDTQLQERTYKVQIVEIGMKQHVILSLFQRNCFSINGKQIANNITSFFVHSEFLLLTTLQHTLVCVSLNEKGFDELIKQDLTVKPWENRVGEKFCADLNVRRVERGSQLIMAIPKDSRTILQMPRGNLECIQPRALSLYIVGVYLNNCDYLLAFDLMRRQRINLNLIYDHNPNKFVENADKFVKQISKASWLSLFLSELQDEDVTRAIYTNYYWKDEAINLSTTIVAKSKIEFVCNLLRNIMEKRNSGNHLIQPILISLVKARRKRGLEAALTKVKDIRLSEVSGETSIDRITSDEALKYLLYIVDVNVLFDTALGMYDFDLTMFIASKSQKDPKEYIPFLTELKQLDENYMKYSIDLYLKRFESALGHIAQQPNRFNECIDLIRKHDLYTNALKLFEKSSVQYKQIAKVYAEFLLSNRRYQEAGIMFYKSGDFSEASNAYKLAGSWQDVIVLSNQMDLSVTEKHALYKELVQRLRADRRYDEAAQILLNYLNDTKEAVISLCSGKHWKDAIRIAHDTHRLDLIESCIECSVYKTAEHVTLQIAKNKEEFEQYKSRLATVRLNISQRNLMAHDEICNNDSIYDKSISDILSDTSSVAGSTTLSQKSKFSTVSGKSYRSSKNRRKHERKLLSLKEGSRFEDIALIQALHRIVSNAYKEKDDLRLLLDMLVYFGADQFAEKLQSSMEQLLLSIENGKQEIWNTSAPSSLIDMEAMQSAVEAEPQLPFLPEKLLESYVTRSPPTANSIPWKLNIF